MTWRRARRLNRPSRFSRPGRDAADRGLSAALRLLPAQRRDWADAMRAELAVILVPAERRRYATGCARAVLRGPGTVRALALPMVAWAIGISLLAVGIGINGPARIEVGSVVVLLGVCCWLGRRPGFLGPAASYASARRIRVVGCAAVAGCLCFFDIQARSRSGGGNDPYGWFLGAALLIDLVTVLAVTARGSVFAARTVAIAARYAGLAALTWWISMLLFGTARANPQLSVLLVTIAVALSSRASFARVGDLPQSLLAGLATAVASCLLIFLGAVGTYALLPRLVPDSVGGVPYGGLTPAAVALHNRVESTDPYVSELLLGSLAALLVIATMVGGAGRSVRHREVAGAARRQAEVDP